MSSYTVYTDGGYSMQNNVGAFAYVMLDGGGNLVRKGAWRITDETNNRAELKAIITAVHHLPETGASVEIISDSQYALNTLSGKWSRNKNTDLFEVWDRVLDAKQPTIAYKWVRGHNGNEYNEMCDRMCNEAAGVDMNAEFAKYKKG